MDVGSLSPRASDLARRIPEGNHTKFIGQYAHDQWVANGFRGRYVDGKQAAGWMGYRYGDKGLPITIDDFWGKYPKELSILPEADVAGAENALIWRSSRHAESDIDVDGAWWLSVSRSRLDPPRGIIVRPASVRARIAPLGHVS